MTRRAAWVSGVGLGAGLMFLLDPDLGRTRRALIRDRLVWLLRAAGRRLEGPVRHLRNRAIGVAAGVRVLAEPVAARERPGRVDPMRGAPPR
jgi:hypothetical protein